MCRCSAGSAETFPASTTWCSTTPCRWPGRWSKGAPRLTELAARFNVEVGRAHHAFDDAYMLAGVVPALNELRMRRARKIAAVNLLDQLGLALAVDPNRGDGEEETLLRDITRPFTLGRYSDCLESYAAEVALGVVAPSIEEVVERLGGRALMERLRAERTVSERYPVAVERSAGAGTGQHRRVGGSPDR